MQLEHWWFKLPLRLRSIFRRRRVETELDEEMQFHLEHKIEEGIAAGLSPANRRPADEPVPLRMTAAWADSAAIATPAAPTRAMASFDIVFMVSP